MFRASLNQAWHALFTLKAQRTEPVWARLLVSAVLALTACSVMFTVSGVLTERVTDVGWWRASFPGNALICVSVAWSIQGMVDLFERVAPVALVERLAAMEGWRFGLLLNALVVCGALLGFAVGLTLFGWIQGGDIWGWFLKYSDLSMKLALFIAVLVLANTVWWQVRVRRRALQHQVTQAQLHLLQAQIEPHFLFNTLANVQCLMDYDPPRAKLMLETFSDYLRVNLGQIRHADALVAGELDMARHFLQLLQIRMGDRLTFQIDADDMARLALLPSLLLQPLIENAIHHGLEPKVDGGLVQVRASVADGRLVLSVMDVGVGPAARRTGRTGHGMALANIRSRLHTRYGSSASLSLQLQETGAVASINVPYETRT